MSDTFKLGVIGGGGWLGKAVVRAVTAAGIVAEADLSLSYRSGRPSGFESAFWTTDNQELADRSDVVVVSVRPADWPAISVNARGKLVLSVMAGIGLAEIAGRLETSRVVRALPNAAAEVGASYTPWVASHAITSEDRRRIAGILDACGMQDELSREPDLDYMTGLSGSGPAFPALLATAMMKDAVARGIDVGIAQRAVVAVLRGTGRLFDGSDEDPSTMVERFVAYDGTTAAAIRAMRESGFDAGVARGLSAALKKLHTAIT